MRMCISNLQCTLATHEPRHEEVVPVIDRPILVIGRQTCNAHRFRLRAFGPSRPALPMAGRMHPAAHGDLCPRRGLGAGARLAHACRQSPSRPWSLTTRAAQGLSVRAPLKPSPGPTRTPTARPRTAPLAVPFRRRATCPPCAPGAERGPRLKTCADLGTSEHSSLSTCFWGAFR
jgi:hypothetical protein